MTLQMITECISIYITIDSLLKMTVLHHLRIIQIIILVLLIEITVMLEAHVTRHQTVLTWHTMIHI